MRAASAWYIIINNRQDKKFTSLKSRHFDLISSSVPILLII